VSWWCYRRVLFVTVILTITLFGRENRISSAWMPSVKWLPSYHRPPHLNNVDFSKRSTQYVTVLIQKSRVGSLRSRASSSSSDTPSSFPSSPNSFSNRPTNASRSSTVVLSKLKEWASSVGIRVSPNLILKSSTNDSNSGLGWFVKQTADNGKLESIGQVILTVPSSIALTVDAETSRSKDISLPWYVSMAIQICQLDLAGTSSEYYPWIQSLPREFDTPLHWTDAMLKSLQYPFLQRAVERQRVEWKQLYDNFKRSSNRDDQISFEQFVWGCECARSRAFAGSYSGSAFSPAVYAFTLLLVTIYVGAGLGTLEQAANGAGVVFAATILKGTR
jgi:hypothetical protein